MSAPINAKDLVTYIEEFLSQNPDNPPDIIIIDSEDATAKRAIIDVSQFKMSGTIVLWATHAELDT